MIADKACWERGCACHRVGDEGIELVEKREWVGLTDKEVVMLAYQSQENECTAIRLAEAKLKEKNT
jgi:hypothetical protein